ncbi:hypothetical protein OB2597_09224 [Pseudooceanicola batsensis HTCC2597]|uniref:DUF2125 domain-containing protein n=1 Tax=Pseudooceanicola batsensis (strain ATCC BAA-863 / DSM 15984 / KCTC 12145 / HTCC2597) TaxID=252305 RepID=A3TUW7_PSEBH|nr:DUF2125 domain-containing protein [Pseudooceanicola batsensis]EAQ04313.1 hypothetical protein OB2597_09224 [Pseudooceanicola batsensis HTCC2597]
MKRLFIVIVIAALAWSVYWFVGATSSRNAFEAWFDARRAEGWVAEYNDFSLAGFPNRFDATWRGLAVADPESGIAVDMPVFQLLALSYRPTHVIAVAPQDVHFATPRNKYDLESDRLRASLRLRPGTALEVERAVLEGEALQLSGAETAAMADLHLAMQRTGETSYRFGLEARDVTPPLDTLRNLLGDTALPAEMQFARLDAQATFDRPWDRSALDSARPQPTQLRLDEVSAEWGVMSLRAMGVLDIDDRGRASGEIDLQATNWQRMLDIVRESEALSENAVRMLAGALSMAAESSGNPDRIDIGLTLRDGQVFLGFIPLGPAPLLRLR